MILGSGSLTGVFVFPTREVYIKPIKGDLIAMAHSDWFYHPQANAIVLALDKLPQAGQQVVVKYVTALLQ